MGEYAEYALAAAMRRGFPATCGGAPRARSKAHPCRLCNRGIRGGHMGMVSHLKSKHGMKDREARTFVCTPLAQAQGGSAV
jgi:hypothetical protein